MASNNPSKALLGELLERILQVVQPLRIILFGSAARNQMEEHSDLDLLVIVPKDVHRRQTAQSIYQNLVGLGFAVDVVVVTEEDVKLYRQAPGLVIKSAMDEGITLYAA